MPDIPDFPTRDDEEEAPDRQNVIDRILGGEPTPGRARGVVSGQ